MAQRQGLAIAAQLAPSLSEAAALQRGGTLALFQQCRCERDPTLAAQAPRRHLGQRDDPGGMPSQPAAAGSSLGWSGRGGGRRRAAVQRVASSADERRLPAWHAIAA